jgi:hypothetical protein
MVDAISRLFGKSHKKGSTSSPGGTPSASNSANSIFESPQPPAPGSNSAAEDEGFTILGQPNRGSYNGYPALPPSETTVSPYPPAPPTTAYPTGTLSSIHSSHIPHLLDGIPFQLSESCSLKSRRNGNDRSGFLDDVQARLESVHQLIESANYDFRLEKSVVESDISATMKRMQTY